MTLKSVCQSIVNRVKSLPDEKRIGNFTHSMTGIKKICGINVSVYIELFRYKKEFYKWLIRIETDIDTIGISRGIGFTHRLFHSGTEDGFKDNENIKFINIDNKVQVDNSIDAFCKIVKEVIPKLKLNIIGELSTEPIDICDDLNFDNVEFYYDECCVCKEYTMTTTKCKHHLCLACWSNCDKNKKCPMCRQALEYDEDEDEDEDY